MTVKETQNRDDGETLLEATLFGPPTFICAKAGPTKIAGRKDRALLAFLLAQPGTSHARDRLVDLFWPLSAGGAGRASLRQSLSVLRAALGKRAGALLRSDRDTVLLARERLATDVMALELMVAEPNVVARDWSCPTGQFLEGLAGVAPDFDSWRATEEARLSQLMTKILDAAAERAESERRLDDAAGFLTQSLARDPLAEASVRRLMRIRSAQNRPDVALRLYGDLEQRLERELDARPERETAEMAWEIRLRRQSRPPVDDAGKASASISEKASGPGKNVGQTVRPSVVLLPFESLGTGDDAEVIARGLTEDITALLSGVEKLFVISANSTAHYRGRSVDLRQVRTEQGAGYALEGTVRQAGPQIRITSKLTACETGQILWSRRFDRPVSDVFAIQDDIAREVTVALQIRLTDGEQAAIWARGTRNLEAWSLTIRASELNGRHVRKDNELARPMAEEAIRLDPSYVDAWCVLGWCHWADARHFWSASETASLRKARDIGEHACSLRENAAEPRVLLALTALQEEAYDDAVRFAEEALRLGRGQSFVVAICAMVFLYCQRPKLAVTLIEEAMRLCPVYPPWYRVTHGKACHLAGETQRAINVLSDFPEYWEGTFGFPVALVAALDEAGRTDEARSIARQAFDAEPDFTITAWAKPQKYSNSRDLERYTAVLMRLGLPE